MALQFGGNPSTAEKAANISYGHSNNPGGGPAAQCSNQDARNAVAYANDPNNPTNVADPNYIQGSGASSGCVRSNGITNIQDFATFGINLGLNFQLNKYAVLMFGADARTDHHTIEAESFGPDRARSNHQQDIGRPAVLRDAARATRHRGAGHV